MRPPAATSARPAGTRSPRIGSPTCIDFRSSPPAATVVGSTGVGAAAFGSNDGGFTFSNTNNTALVAPPTEGRHAAGRVDGSLDLKDVYDKANGQVTFYHQSLEGGYAAPGLATATDMTQSGVSLKALRTSGPTSSAAADEGRGVCSGSAAAPSAATATRMHASIVAGRDVRRVIARR